MKEKFIGQAERNFQGGSRESELSSSNKKALSETMGMTTAVRVPGKNDKKVGSSV